MDIVAKHVSLAVGLLLSVAVVGQVEAKPHCTIADGDQTIRVETVEALQIALNEACPGTEILVGPGQYHGRITVNADTKGTAEAPIIVRAEKGLGSATIDAAGSMITWKFDGSSFIHLKDLQITGGGYHGIFFAQGSNNLLVENNRVFDNHQIRPMTSHAEIKGSGSGGGPEPHDIVLRGNEIFHTEHPPGSNFQGIDCNFCWRFHVIDNHIYDIKKPTALEYSFYDRGSCVQFKSTSRDVIIDNNLIERCNIGIVLGGEGLANPENISGIVRNNTVTGYHDIGLAIVNARDFKVYGNRFIGPEQSIILAKDGEFPEGTNTGLIEDNELSHDLFSAADFDVEVRGNLVLSP